MTLQLLLLGDAPVARLVINGVPSVFDPPGSTSTTINGVNDLGQLVGILTEANDNTIGFIHDPLTITPEPGSLAPLPTGLFAVSVARRRRKAAQNETASAPELPRRAARIRCSTVNF